MTSPTSPVETQKGKGNHRLLLGFVLTLGVVLVLLILFGHRGVYQIYRLGQERQHLEQENARLAAENDRLTRTIDRLQHDPEFIQELIRRELNFVKRNEMIFQFPPEGQEKSPVASPSPQSGPPTPAQSPSGPPGKAGKPRWAWESLVGAPKKGAAPKAE